ncbi:hypothetical protein LOK49_LG15G02589 [Camellia lanceoleosa]|uniref:Uncharacterized protein n=1 Tax=Camellia lanceoleosa TaxID=1840588 RepID=A0ACC0F832_9ERIC|nr:hypothetical protein LOK49_LG15G02589 [Camellia lanceoleosa]
MDKEYEIRDHVFIKVTPMKGQTRFGVKGKLAPRYVGPYEVLEKINSVTYQVALPPVMKNMHNVFHVSMLQDYLRDPLHVIELTHVLLKDDYTYEERPIQIVNHRIKRLRNKKIPLVQVDWQNYGGTYATWETEEDMMKRYPDLFPLDLMFFQNEVITGGLDSKLVMWDFSKGSPQKLVDFGVPDTDSGGSAGQCLNLAFVHAIVIPEVDMEDRLGKVCVVAKGDGVVVVVVIDIESKLDPYFKC